MLHKESLYILYVSCEENTWIYTRNYMKMIA